MCIKHFPKFSIFLSTLTRHNLSIKQFRTFKVFYTNGRDRDCFSPDIPELKLSKILQSKRN